MAEREREREREREGGREGEREKWRVVREREGDWVYKPLEQNT